MYKGTTPTFTLTLPETVNLNEAVNVYVTFARKGEKVLQKTGDDLTINANVVEVYLSQDETVEIPAGTIEIQINWTYLDGTETKRACSDIAQTFFKRNLEPEVLA